MINKKMYAGFARFCKGVEFEIELTDEEFNNGEWYDIAIEEAKKFVTLEFLEECNDIEIEGCDLELLEDE